jgi:4'-phosphopantetheinyl transferase
MSMGTSHERPASAATIEVWVIELDQPLNPGVKLDNILSKEERKRAEGYRYAKDATRFRKCRAMLRLGLARYLEKSPREIALTANRYGKPEVADPAAVRFNVTHSEGLGLIAFSIASEVGIDVETIGRDVEMLELAAANFTTNEAAMVAAAQTEDEQARFFFRLWTRKEAVLKAAGCGIANGLKGVDVSCERLNRIGVRVRLEEASGICWRVDDLVVGEGFAAAIAAPVGDWTVVLRRVGWEEASNGYGW